ncbi:hypothetical protein HYW18_03515 [Candidatus Uhrbacteria bacterium]|nr:hypothetical protein [Candidatus Uhrbacteria bacterium]
MTRTTRVSAHEDVRVHGLYLWTPATDEGVTEMVMVLAPKIIQDTASAIGSAPCLNAVGLRHGYHMSIPLYEAGLFPHPVTFETNGRLEDRGDATAEEIKSLILAAYRTSNDYKREVLAKINDFFLSEANGVEGSFLYGGLAIDKPRTSDIDFGVFVSPDIFTRNILADIPERRSFAIGIRSARVWRVAARLTDLFGLDARALEYLAWVLRGGVSADDLHEAHRPFKQNLGVIKGLTKKLDIQVLPPLPMDPLLRHLYNEESLKKGWDPSFLDRMAGKMRLWNPDTQKFDPLGTDDINLGSPGD